MTGTIYQGYALDAEGNVLDGASVEVRDQDTNSLVTIWSNRATTTTKTNPTTTDSNGYFFFYRTAGRYKITVTKDAFTSVFNNVSLGNAQELDTGTSAGKLVLYDDFGAVAFSNSYDDLDDLPTLGTMAALDSGTGGSNFRTNTQNDTRFLRVANNLNDVTASSARANLDLSNIYSLEGVVTNTHIPLKRAGAFVDSPLSFDGNDAATFGGNGPTTFNHDVDIDGALTVDTIDTGQGAVECYAMDQPVRTTDVPTFGNATADGHALNRVTADGRYGQLGTANSWTGDQDITGAITANNGVANHIVTQRSQAAAEGARQGITITLGSTGDSSSGSIIQHYSSDAGGAQQLRNFIRMYDTGIEIGDDTNVTGAISATTGVTPAASQDAITAWKNRTAYTPTVSGSGGSAGSFAATTTAGEYTRIGDFCIAKIRLDTITDKGSWTGDVRFSLPFAAVSNGSVFGGGTIETMEQHTFTGQLSAFTLNGQSYARIRTFSSAGTPGYLQWSDLTTAAGNDIAFTVIYTVA